MSALPLMAHPVEVQIGGHRGYGRQGVALVDAADAEAVGAYRWCMDGNGYAMRTIRAEGKRLTVLMHRFLLGLAHGDPRQGDHVNGDTLDNRRANLRVCTSAENHQNRHDRPHRGATWHAGGNCWQAQAMLAGKRHYLGSFATQEEAATAAAAFRREHMPFSADARPQAMERRAQDG
jgi:hypothetical protein